MNRIDRREQHPKHHWSRIVADRELDSFIEEIGPEHLSVAEVSGSYISARHTWKSRTLLEYPSFDLCAPSPAPALAYDVVICAEVLEHVLDPWLAVETLYSLCKPGGYVLITTPFLLRYHPAPEDYWRFTPAGLTVLMERAGLEPVHVAGWGNAACVRANFYRWANFLPWSSLKNEPTLMVSVWAIARRPNASDPSHPAAAGDESPRQG
jgi:SAM-dependent methyltransferase